MNVDHLVAQNIIGQLGPLLSAQKWSLGRPPANMLRGVDFYNTTDFVAALLSSAQQFRERHGYLPQIGSPTTFNEHIFARKFFAALPLPSLADKLGVRDYVQARLGESVLPTIAWVGDNAEELFAANLPAGRFLLKANHGSGMLQMLNLPGDLMTKRAEIERAAREWLGYRFGYESGEWQYCTFKPKLFLEEFFNFEGDKGTPDDFKFFCFGGYARLIQVHSSRYTRHKCGQYDRSWKHLPVQFETYEIAEFERPANFNAMIQAAETISAGLDFARVDLYSDRKSIIKFGEITLTPGNANDRYGFEFDRWLGSWFLAGQ